MAPPAPTLTAPSAVFSNDLTYVPGMAPRSANQSTLVAGGMQALIIVWNFLDRFMVEADRHIKDLTIITEYVGEVDYLRNCEHDDGDSMMTLLSAEPPSKSLVICLDKRSNIARFINGINNHTPEGRKKQNLKCVRFAIDGFCRPGPSFDQVYPPLGAIITTTASNDFIVISTTIFFLAPAPAADVAGLGPPQGHCQWAPWVPVDWVDPVNF
uniref:Uncharacterized protein n=1 Tax=Aegilops tauschii TaxID=37682 RepID=M8B400_AEGTA